MAQIEVFHDGNGFYKYRVKDSEDGEILVTSQAYRGQEVAARAAANLIVTLVELNNHPPVKVEFK